MSECECVCVCVCVCVRGFLHRGADNEALAEGIYFWE